MALNQKMAMAQKLELRQGQTLIMTPQLQQAIKLLQLSNMELQAYIQSELERNPLLESSERSELETQSDDRGEAATDNGEAMLVQPGTLADDDAFVDLAEKNQEARPSDDMTAAFVDQSGQNWASYKSSNGLSLDHNAVEFGSTLSRRLTLADHLTDQMPLYLHDPADRLIGQYLIGNLDEAGYLTTDIETIAATLGTSCEHVERILAQSQRMEPLGAFSRSLRECLSLQLSDQGPLEPSMVILLDHLDLVGRRDLAKLKALCGTSLEEITQLIAKIKRLNPKPGHAFGSEPVQLIVPDVFVRAHADGSWLIELNNETLPRLLVSNHYVAQLSQSGQCIENKNYLTVCQANANWLIKSLDQRAKTILKVANEIVRRQDAFFMKGVQHLKPINLKNIAEAIDMHESTVSRVTSNKYMATPRGLFEMKYFFTMAIASTDKDGECHSAESVRHRIKEMLTKEAGGQILSDGAIVTLLKREGIEIARRTVTKYRETLGIPSSIQRRRDCRNDRAL